MNAYGIDSVASCGISADGELPKYLTRSNVRDGWRGGYCSVSFNWFVGALTPAYAMDVSTTLSVSDGHCPAVIERVI